MINSRGKRVDREAVFLTTFVFVRVEDKNLNEIRFRSDVYKMLSEPGKSAPYAIPDTKFDNFSEREFEEKVATSIILRLMVVSLFSMDTLGIDWKIPTEHANLSEKDTKHAMLNDSPLYIKNVTLSL